MATTLKSTKFEISNKANTVHRYKLVSHIRKSPLMKKRRLSLFNNKATHTIIASHRIDCDQSHTKRRKEGTFRVVAP